MRMEREGGFSLESSRLESRTLGSWNILEKAYSGVISSSASWHAIKCFPLLLQRWCTITAINKILLFHRSRELEPLCSSCITPPCGNCFDVLQEPSVILLTLDGTGLTAILTPVTFEGCFRSCCVHQAAKHPNINMRRQTHASGPLAFLLSGRYMTSSGGESFALGCALTVC